MMWVICDGVCASLEPVAHLYHNSSFGKGFSPKLMYMYARMTNRSVDFVANVIMSGNNTLVVLFISKMRDAQFSLILYIPVGIWLFVVRSRS